MSSNTNNKMLSVEQKNGRIVTGVVLMLHSKLDTVILAVVVLPSSSLK